MLSVTVIAVGKLGEAHWVAAAGEYTKRLGALCKPSVIEIDEHRLPKNPSPAQVKQGLEAEGKAILDKIPGRAFVIPLCIEGKAMSSEALGKKLASLSATTSQVVFVIGGSHGLSDAVKARGGLKLSMSPMTFPHQLARVMLLEQVYRALGIGAGMPYHK